ncbi:MAG: serine/threonine protein kinase [Deltaproteobacteria bacterium]|nr:serine/threonine protein kinase [Deltaproteobacteria bacterium]
MTADDPNREPSEPSSSSTTSIGMPFEIGSVIAGKYRIDRILGAGGMGVIFAGHHAALDQRVAIKVLKPSAIDNAEFVARFGREARAAAKLRSEHVARVIDVGESDKGLPFMVMEYLSGKDLSRVLKDGGPLPIEDACEYVLQACEGLAEAHAAGIVHRDLKPANLFLTTGTDGTPLVKVLDFGISKILSSPGDDSAPSEGLTQTQAMIGSPHYMSPEQLKSARNVDARTDIWSLGGVLFKLLTNEPAFEGDSTPELCVSILVGPLRSMRAIRPDIPEDLEALVGKCLSKDPKDRFATVSDLARALSRFGPAHTRSSVERIARVTTNPRLRFGGDSDPPPNAPASVPRLEKTAPLAPASGADAVDVKLEMTTLTSSASSVPNERLPSQSSATATASPERKRSPLVLGAVAAALVVVAIGVAFALGRGKAEPPSATPAVTPPPPSALGAGATAATASAAPSVTPPAPAEAQVSPAATTAAPPASSPSAAASTIVPGKSGARPAGAHVPAAAPAAKAPPPKASAAPAPVTPAPAPSPALPGMPDFGGRK